jgi:hypothetical protein
MDTKPYRPAVRDLAARIYTKLVSTTSTDGPAALEAAPAMALLSFRLAEAFQAVDDQFTNANSLRTSDFKLGADAIAEWSKK